MASNRREEPKEVRIPDEVIFGVEVDEDHYNSCDEDDDGRLLITEASEEDCRALRKEWEMESEAQTISNTDENLAENGAKNQNDAEEDDEDEDIEKPRPKTSIADHYFKRERLVWFSFDLETIKSGIVRFHVHVLVFQLQVKPKKKLTSSTSMSIREKAQFGIIDRLLFMVYMRMTRELKMQMISKLFGYNFVIM